MQPNTPSQIASAERSDAIYGVLREEQRRIDEREKHLQELDWDVLHDCMSCDEAESMIPILDSELNATEAEIATSRQLIQEMKEAGAVALKDSGVVLHERAFGEAGAAGVHINIEQPEATTQPIEVHRSPVKD